MSQVTEVLVFPIQGNRKNFKDGKIIEGFIADKCYHILVQTLSPRGSGKDTECKQVHFLIVSIAMYRWPSLYARIGTKNLG